MRFIRKDIDRRFGRAVIFAAVVTTTVIACHGSREVRASIPVERLAAVASRSGRRTEARFSGNFPWAPVRAAQAAKRSVDEADLEVVAGAILAESDRSGSIESLHAAGIARGLLGSFDESVSRLERVCLLAPKDANAWNDLAAARYALAANNHEPQRLPSALSAVDRALSLAPSLPPARFNRALILTRLGMRNEAMPAWRDARAAERDRAWAREAAERASALRGDAAPPVEPELAGALTSADAGNEAPLRAVVAARPQQTRTIAETTMLASWADALHARRRAEAERALERIRQIGDLLVSVNGDRLLSDVVQSIASAPPADRRRLAAALLAYRHARIDYAKRRRDGAEELRRVAESFAHMRNPMEHVARYYYANALLDGNRLEESRAALVRVLDSINAADYPSLAAGAEKELGLYYGFRGMWTASLTHLERARAGFSAQREPTNAAFAEATTGEAYDLIGDFQRGWERRTAALDVLTRSRPDYHSLSVMIGAVHAEVMRGDYESALSLLQVARQEAAHVRIPDVTAEMTLSEARVLLIARGVPEARVALADAKRIAATIQDEGIRKRLDAEAELVEAAILRRSDPGHAAALVTPAIAFFRSHGLGILLPAAYLERGRAEVACGAREAAKADLDAGLRSIEHQRANVRVDVRTTLFDTVPELTGQMVDLLLREGDTRGAYAVVERARARTLIEALGLPQMPSGAAIETIAAALPPNAIVIEYALLPDGVAAFCIDRKGMTVHRLAVKPSQLRRAIPELRARIQERKAIDSVQETAAQLYTDLLRPLEPAIGNATVLYLVPDRFLNATPFSALYDKRAKQYLIQKQRLILAPSGAFLLRQSRGKRRIRPALIIADPTSPAGGKRLDAARREALATAELFDAPPPLVGRDATIARFLSAAPESALIHYAGHAHSDDTAGGFLPLAPSADSDGRLDATAISRMRLRRTNLVVLSACATMRGDVSRVEGMPSLSRAFLNAHARAVVGMLWEVDDEVTAALLAPFHRRVRDGMSPSQALQEAQLEMLHSDRADLRHPAAWAAAAFLGMD